MASLYGLIPPQPGKCQNAKNDRLMDASHKATTQSSRLHHVPCHCGYCRAEVRHAQEQATLWHFQRTTVWTYRSSTVFQTVLKGYHHGPGGAKSSKWSQRLWGVQFKKNTYPIAPEVCWHPWFSSVAYACTIWQNLALFLWVNVHRI